MIARKWINGSSKVINNFNSRILRGFKLRFKKVLNLNPLANESHNKRNSFLQLNEELCKQIARTCSSTKDDAWNVMEPQLSNFINQCSTLAYYKLQLKF